MKYSIFIAFAFIVFIAGCYPEKENIEVLSAQNDSYELYLYSSTDQKEQAQNYLSALLDWKSMQTGQLKFKQSTSSMKDIGISQGDLPALIIKREGQVISNLSGEYPSQDILSTLEKSITMAK